MRAFAGGAHREAPQFYCADGGKIARRSCAKNSALVELPLVEAQRLGSPQELGANSAPSVWKQSRAAGINPGGSLHWAKKRPRSCPPRRSAAQDVHHAFQLSDTTMRTRRFYGAVARTILRPKEPSTCQTMPLWPVT